MNFQFTKATRTRSKLRLALDGPSGSGKTYTSLIAATVMANGGRIAVIDTERGSASLYSDKFSFDVLELDTFSPEVYTRAIHAAEKAGYDVIVIDSLSHAWEGEGGALDLVDQAAARIRGNSYAAWKDVTPLQRQMVDAMLQSPAHIIVTMRSKMDYVQDKDDKGKTTIRKVGMAPVQRSGMEYEFTIVCDMDIDHKLIVSKSRCEVVADKVVTRPGDEFFEVIKTWLNEGEAPEQKPMPTPETPATNGATRPYPPDVLHDKLTAAAEFYKGKSEQATDHQRKVLAAQLTTLFDGDDTKRYEFSKWATGVASTKEMDDGYVLSMLNKWLEVDAFDTPPNEYAMQEAKAALPVALKAAGQGEMELN